MKKIILLITTIFSTLSLVAGDKVVNMQGKLTDSAGTALTGSQTLTFRLYNTSTDTVSSAIWIDTFTVTASSGLFNVALGTNVSLDTLPFNKTYYVGLQVAGDPSEMTPRQALGAQPSALGSVGNFSASKDVYVSGNVGIGTTSPQRSLHISGGDGVEELFQNTGVSSGNQTWGLQAYQGNLNFRTLNDGASAETGVGKPLSITRAGKVGVGTTSPTAALHVIGSLTASGSKNFTISHPLDDTKLLVHSSVESPEQGLIYRGKAQLQAGVVAISLPDYFEGLVAAQDRSVQLTCVNGYSPLFVEGEVAKGRFTVRTAAGGNNSQEFFWMVQGKRADPEAMDDPFQVVIDKPAQDMKPQEWSALSLKRRRQLQRLYKLKVQ